MASIMQAAEKGATTLSHGTEKKDAWTITDAGSPQAWQKLDPVTAYALQSLGVPGKSFTADKTVKAGKKLTSSIDQFEAATRSWARENGLMVSAGIGGLGSLLVLGAGALAGYLAVANPFDLSVIALVPGLFAVFGLETLRPGSTTRRTTPGRAATCGRGSAASGASSPPTPPRRASTSPAARSSTPPTSRGRSRSASPTPGRRSTGSRSARSPRSRRTSAPRRGGYAGGSFASSMADDFSSTVDNAISAYQASQSSSSSSGGGGGGFSGGGGGGGGGGGSW